MIYWKKVHCPKSNSTRFRTAFGYKVVLENASDQNLGVPERVSDAFPNVTNMVIMRADVIFTFSDRICLSVVVYISSDAYRLTIRPLTTLASSVPTQAR